MNLPAEISVTELAAMHEAGERFVLLDVREDDEVATARLAWATHIPMGAIPDRIAELRPEADIVVMCHGGMRSARVARYLRERGYGSVANLAGGIDAWSTLVDPSVPTY